ncbi:MAG TPA: hypothetical protein VKH20_09245 [Solirubrobacterales bacterium]|nr:hypothetical protein [Solirubrobacterales bacterium]
MRKRLLLLPCILILSALVFAACGSSGGDDGEIEEVIETSATSTDPADCKKLNTQQFVEQTTQESGNAAVKECEKEAKEEEGAKSVSVSVVEVNGSDATAEAALSGGNLDGQTLELALVKDGDQWKLNEVVKFTKFDQGKLVGSLEASLAEASSEVDPKFARCVIEHFKQGSQPEVEELLFGNSPKALEEVFEACTSSPSA